MAESDELLPERYVLPGESHLVSEPTIMRTVLGSCVGITFWVPRLGVAALSHSMLPSYPLKPPASMSSVVGHRYVDYAIRDLAQRFDVLGARRNEVEVKLFGGGDVLLVTEEVSRPTVGKLNCAAALRVLGEEGFVVAASSLGGNCGLNIHFHTGSGDVLLRRLN